MTASSSVPSLGAVSDRLASLIGAVSTRLVTIHGGRRGSSTGILWQPGFVVAAEEALEADEDLTIVDADGAQHAATLVGRDPSTDIALLRTETRSVAGELSVTSTDAIQVGHLAIVAGRRREGLAAMLGIVALAGGSWRSLRGGTIDRLIHLDVRPDPHLEGAAAIDAEGRVFGMIALGPRGRVLVIPSETIERVVRQLRDHGRIARGYLGVGVQPLRVDEAIAAAVGLEEPRSLMVVSVDPGAPGDNAGLRQGDVLIAWNKQPLRSIRGLYALLGAESVGQPVELGVLRAGERIALTAHIQERPHP
ncbi:S1C family serine protease [Microvirga puerhi]|uniref:S1C family serine protease n=1 Tax=Microvirga puerhi TaxID=2876078 RepID=A0ABS7VUE0_9HYPH|nr:S1C family serine protease [Microvirga puerhi]MBZ6079175.1 S1C family serine protease [Microvirga puerhi]